MAEWSPIGGTLVSSAKGRSWREEAACWLLAESGPGSSHWPDRLQEAGLLTWEDQENEDWDLAFVRWEALAVTSDTRTTTRPTGCTARTPSGPCCGCATSREFP